MRRILFFLPLLLATLLRAQSVSWDPSGGTLGAGQVIQLNLVFDHCEPSGDVALPKVPGVTFGPPQRSQSSSMRVIINNGTTQSTNLNSVTLAYAVNVAAKTGSFEIPAFDVVTNSGPKHIAAAQFTIGPATVTLGQNGNNKVALDSVAQSHLTLPDSVWVGEVFPLTYTLEIQQSYADKLAGNPSWNSTPLVVEDDWKGQNKPEISKISRNNQIWVDVTYHTRASTQATGDVSFDSVSQEVSLQTGIQNFGIFNQVKTDQYIITSTPAPLKVKPLPTPAPAAFTGAVGDFKFGSNIAPNTVAVGEPITWTLTLSGNGNWPHIRALPARTVSRDFHVVTPGVQRTGKDGVLFDAGITEDVILIPTKPGVYTLGPISFACFDPKSGTYQDLTTKPFTVTVTAPPSVATTPAGGPVSPSATPGNGPPQPPRPPAGLPRDPLPPASAVSRPLAFPAFLSLVLAPLALLPLFWLAFAARHAQLTDPLRPRREARRRLAVTLGELRAGPNPKIPGLTAPLLRRWQPDSATLFGVTLAAPSSSVLEAATGAAVPDNKDWAALWHEADRTLYGPLQPLPTDWVPRAEAALETKIIRPFQPLNLFFLSNLFPGRSRRPVKQKTVPHAFPSASPATATLLLLILLLSAIIHPPSVLAAPDAAASYRAADFPAAEKAWRATLATAPTDWSAHYNLALALAQQNRWAESAAHSLAALVQQPQNPATRWQLNLAYKSAGWAPDPSVSQLTDGFGTDLATLASPAQWQWLAAAAALLAAAGLALFLWRAYGASGRWLSPVAWTALLSGLLLGGAATWSLNLYGPLADTRAVLVWQAGVLRSIPTEADTTQKTIPLAPGLVAVVDKTFLEGRWVRLAFTNGQTGWVRQEDLVSLW